MQVWAGSTGAMGCGPASWQNQDPDSWQLLPHSSLMPGSGVPPARRSVDTLTQPGLLSVSAAARGAAASSPACTSKPTGTSCTQSLILQRWH